MGEWRMANNEIILMPSNGYQQLIGTKNPGLIMILLDQSGSMSDNNKASLAAKAVNRVIYEIVLASRSGETIKDRCHVGVIGYGRDIEPVVGGKISDVAASPIRIEKVMQKMHDGAGGLLEVEQEMPIWVDPKSQNGTPMAAAINKAFPIIEDWTVENPNSFPPVVINITDGEPNDFSNSTGKAPETEAAANSLMNIKTTDGKLLFFNGHIVGDINSPQEIKLPNSDAGLPNNYARLLYRISSVLPNPLIQAAQSVGLSPQNGSRGFVYNAAAETLIQLLTFGSTQLR